MGFFANDPPFLEAHQKRRGYWAGMRVPVSSLGKRTDFSSLGSNSGGERRVFTSNFFRPEVAYNYPPPRGIEFHLL